MPLDFDIETVTVDEADAYALSRGHADWTDAPSSPADEKEAALRRATDYIAGRYNTRWASSFDADDAPAAVKYAIVEAARLELATPGALTPQSEAGGRLKRVRERVEGAVEREREWADGPVNIAPTVTAIDNLLRGAGLIRAAGWQWLARV